MRDKYTKLMLFVTSEMGSFNFKKKLSLEWVRMLSTILSKVNGKSVELLELLAKQFSKC
jgi:hypothetical protein